MKNIIPVANFVSSAIRDAFYLLNSFAFSYFVVSLISFYNVTLLYYFLNISTLPGFVRMFVLSLAYIFYSRGSVLDMVQRFGWISNDFQPDFSDLDVLEKMPLFKGDHNYWFAYYNIYTNYLQTNLEPLLLLGFLTVKFCLLKILMQLFSFPKHKVDISWQRFFQHFSVELSCFAPFFTISCVTTLLDISESTFFGRMNSALQVLTLAVLILVPTTCLVLSLRQRRTLTSIMTEFKSAKTFAVPRRSS